MTDSLKFPLISILSSLFLALFFAISSNVTPVVNGPEFSQAPYLVGESLTYNVSYSNFPSVAHVQVGVVSRGPYSGRDAFQLEAHVETTEIVSVALFSIDNDYSTFVDAENGLPIHALVVTHQGTKESESSRDFAPTSEGTSQSSIGGVFDFLSAFYRLRALSLAPGSTYSLSVKGESDSYTIEVRPTEHQSIKTNAGSFNTIVAQGRVSSSLIRNVQIYFSDDQRHIPVLITAKVATGELRIELAGIELIPPKVLPTVAPLATPIPAPSTTVPVTPGPSTIAATASDEWPFKVGEQLNYQLYLGPTPTVVGTANFQVRGRSRYFDHEGLWLSVRAQTAGPVQKLFVANDQIDSYVDPKSLLPYRSEYKLIEGRRRLNQILTLNQDYGTATSDQRQRIEIPIGTHDYLSFFYAMRTFNLTPPRKSAVSLLVENRPKTLQVSGIRRELIQLHDQKIQAIALTLTTDDPQPDKFQLRVWVSDDKRRLPLRITCVTELGPLRADLAILPTTPQ